MNFGTERVGISNGTRLIIYRQPIGPDQKVQQFYNLIPMQYNIRFGNNINIYLVCNPDFINFRKVIIHILYGMTAPAYLRNRDRLSFFKDEKLLNQGG